jgi:hypothetical protein
MQRKILFALLIIPGLMFICLLGCSLKYQVGTPLPSPKPIPTNIANNIMPIIKEMTAKKVKTYIFITGNQAKSDETMAFLFMSNKAGIICISQVFGLSGLDATRYAFDVREAASQKTDALVLYGFNQTDIDAYQQAMKDVGFKGLSYILTQ